RLHDDIAFKINCGFLVSDEIPSEASYSRLITQLEESNILEKSKKSLFIKLLKKVILSMRPSQLMQHILNPVIKHHLKKKSQSLNPKNVGVNQRRNATNGLKNKPKKKLICQYTKRRLKINYMFH